MIQIRIATAIVISKRGGHLQLLKRLKYYYSHTNSDSACCFEKGSTSSVREEIEGRIFEYMDRNMDWSIDLVYSFIQ